MIGGNVMVTYSYENKSTCLLVIQGYHIANCYDILILDFEEEKVTIYTIWIYKEGFLQDYTHKYLPPTKGYSQLSLLHT